MIPIDFIKTTGSSNSRDAQLPTGEIISVIQLPKWEAYRYRCDHINAASGKEISPTYSETMSSAAQLMLTRLGYDNKFRLVFKRK